jgi:tetratricopeptide (TPR) repeat protein
MRRLVMFFLLIPVGARADLPLDVTRHGIVYRVPGMAKVTVKKDIRLAGAPGFDLYRPAGKPAARLPVVVFINGVGDGFAGKLKDWQIYQDWARLIAARGHAAILHETDPQNPRGSIVALFEKLAAGGAALGIDPDRIAVWACSGNVSPAMPFLMDDAPRGVRAAVIYYGVGPARTLRKDLPLFYVLAGKDGAGLIQGEREIWRRAVEEKVPWTMVDAPGLPHAFDALDTGEDSRRAVAMTLAFIDAQLDALPAPPPPSKTRDILYHNYGQEFDQAAAKLEPYVAKNPRDIDGWLSLASARRNQGKTADAERAYQQALALEPDHVGAIRWLGIMKAQAGDCAGAAPHYARLAALGREDGFAIAALGACEIRAKRPDDAVKTLQRAIAAGNQQPAVHYNLACAYAQAGRRDEALTALETAVADGYTGKREMAEDADLAPLRGEARFQALLQKLR